MYFATACICLCVGALQLAIALFRGRDTWLFWASASNLLLGLGFAANSANAHASTLVTIVCANGLTICGYLTLVMSAWALAGRPPRLVVWPGVMAISACAALLLGDADGGYGMRVGTLSLVFAACDLAVLREGLLLANRDKLRTAWGVVLLFMVTAGVLLVRSAFAFSGGLDNRPSSGQLQVSLAIVGVSVVCLRAVMMFVVSSERRHQLWEKLALHDVLTGALNRAGLAEMTERRWSRDVKDGPLSACVLLIDVDRFKAVNDSEGHDAGDALLCLVAETIRAELRKTDLVARQGGDEFVVFLPATDLDAALLIAERIRARFQVAAQARHGRIEPTLSIGASVTTQTSLDLKVLLSQADQALYASKRAGRNVVSSYALAA